MQDRSIWDRGFKNIRKNGYNMGPLMNNKRKNAECNDLPRLKKQLLDNLTFTQNRAIYKIVNRLCQLLAGRLMKISSCENVHKGKLKSHGHDTKHSSENKHTCLSRSCVESPTLQLQSE